MVEKSYSHKGIGSKLFSAAIDTIKKKQVNYFTLFTAENNIDAIQFYKRNGMTPLYTHLLDRLCRLIVIKAIARGCYVRLPHK